MKLFPHALLDDLTARALASPRLRANHNIHASPADPVQRFFIATGRDTYFRPHRHLNKTELALILRGQFDILTFDDLGSVTARCRVGSGTDNLAFETPRATWHTLLAVDDGATFLEIKEGPYDPAAAAEFAAWAPAEGDPGVSRFQEWLRQAEPGAAPWQAQPAAPVPGR